MMVAVLAWGLVLGLGLVPAAPTSAAAAPSASDVDVIWHAPDECPDRADIAVAIDRVVRSRAAPGAKPRAQVDGIVANMESGGFVIDLKITVPEGETRRRVAARSCREAADAAVALVASMVEPDTAAAAMQVTAADPLAPVAPPSAGAARAPYRMRGLLRVSGVGSFGVLPRWGGGPELAGGLDIARARIELRTFVDAPQRAIVSDTEVTASFIAWSGAALGCFVPGRGTITVPLCAGPELSWVRGQADGLEVGRTANRVVVDVMGNVALAYAPVDWLALRAEVGGLVVLTPGRFVIEDFGAVHRIRAGGVRLSLGVEFRFPAFTRRHREVVR